MKISVQLANGGAIELDHADLSKLGEGLMRATERNLALEDAMKQLSSDMLHFGGLIHDEQGHDEPYATCTRSVCGGIRRAIERAEGAIGE